LKTLGNLGKSYLNTQQKLIEITQFQNLGEFPFTWENGLDCVGVNISQNFNPIDWSYSGKCLIAMKNEAFILDPYNPMDH
jgi:hypothetical protein